MAEMGRVGMWRGGGSYRFGGGNGSRTGSGLIFARIAFNVRMRGDNGNRSPSIMSSSALSRFLRLLGLGLLTNGRESAQKQAGSKGR